MFTKDILLIDEEATGLDHTRHEIIQIAGVLLDKKTLKEKKHFVSYVRPKKWRTRDPEAMKVNHITWDQVKDAPDIKTVIQKLHRTFGTNVILSTYVGNLDITFLKTAFKNSKLKYPFDHHVFDIWAVLYVMAAKKRLLTSKKDFAGFSQESLLAGLGMAVPASLHDALVDCRTEADLLRRALKELRV